MGRLVMNAIVVIEFQYFITLVMSRAPVQNECGARALLISSGRPEHSHLSRGREHNRTTNRAGLDLNQDPGGRARHTRVT